MPFRSNAEVMALLNSGEGAFEVLVGGEPVYGAKGVVGVMAATKDILHGNPAGAVEGEFTIRVRARLDECEDGSTMLRILSEDIRDFCPSLTSVPPRPEDRKPVLVVHGQARVDRRATPRDGSATPPRSTPAVSVPSATRRAAFGRGLKANLAALRQAAAPLATPVLLAALLLV